MQLIDLLKGMRPQIVKLRLKPQQPCSVQKRLPHSSSLELYGSILAMLLGLQGRLTVDILIMTVWDSAVMWA